jgi:hypothetical protein
MRASLKTSTSIPVFKSKASLIDGSDGLIVHSLDVLQALMLENSFLFPRR